MAARRAAVRIADEEAVESAIVEACESKRFEIDSSSVLQ